MLAIAAGGLLVNLAGLAILNTGKHDSLNVRGAWLHVLSDALGSVGGHRGRRRYLGVRLELGRPAGLARDRAARHPLRLDPAAREPWRPDGVGAPAHRRPRDPARDRRASRRPGRPRPPRLDHHQRHDRALGPRGRRGRTRSRGSSSRRSRTSSTSASRSITPRSRSRRRISTSPGASASPDSTDVPRPEPPTPSSISGDRVPARGSPGLRHAPRVVVKRTERRAIPGLVRRAAFASRPACLPPADPEALLCALESWRWPSTSAPERRRCQIEKSVAATH